MSVKPGNVATATIFHHPIGDRAYIQGGGHITEGLPGGFRFSGGHTAPNGETYGIVADDPTGDGWWSAQNFGEYNPDVSASAGGARYHTGEDWNLGSGNDDEGQAVYAAASGLVVRMGDDGIGTYGRAFGNYVVVKHWLADGSVVYSLYAHLKSIDPSIYTTTRGDIVGATVSLDQEIGKLGHTGDAASAHLHFEMYAGELTSVGTILDELGYSNAARPAGWIDPTDFINAHSGQSGHTLPADDFNNDGYGDILWYAASNGSWGYMDVHNNNAWHGGGTSGTAYKIVATGDFNADGFSDVLWRNDSSGAFGYSDLHGNAWRDLGGSSTSYKIVGAGDFNNDGYSDVAWRNPATGEWGYSDHNGTWKSGIAGTAYNIVGIGDFNADKYSDMLWRNDSTGSYGYFDLRGNAWHDLGGSSTAYKIVATGDFNNDGYSDLFWRNPTTGEWGYSDHNGTWKGGTAGTEYKVVDVADYNGDKYSDVLWRNDSNGDFGYFDLNNSAWHGLGSSSTAWQIV